MDKEKVDDLKAPLEIVLMQCAQAIDEILARQARIKHELNEIALTANKRLTAINRALLEAYRRLESLEQEEDA